MSLETRTLTPTVVGAAKKLSDGLWCKQVLPKGQIKYKGRTVDINDALYKQIIDAHNKKAFDQTSLQLANDKGDHPSEAETKLDPSRWNGEVVDYDVRDDGLWATLRVTDELDKLLEKNPKLGVSVALDQNYERVDGEFFPAAIQHVLATIDPRVPGMKPWERVKLANEANTLVDLTEGEISTEEVSNEMTAPGGNATDSEVGEITDEQLAGALALLMEGKPDGTGSNEDETVETETEQPAGDPVLLGRVLALETRLARQSFEAEKADWVNDGVPPAMIDKAEALLTRPESNRIELSRSGETLDAAAIVREVLNEARGTIQLGREVGHGEGVPTNSDELLNAWEAQS